MTAPGVVEMCSGYGGATQGILDAGLIIEAAYDIWPVAVEQHHTWLPGVPCEVRDVATITPDELAGRFVWASLPCQPWSRANVHKDKRGKNHPHYYSLAHFARQVQHARVAVIENVPGLVEMADGQAELRELERECARLGLTVSIHLIASHRFGIEQRRRRVFVVIGRDLPLILIRPSGEAVSDPQNAVTCHSSGYNVHSHTVLRDPGTHHARSIERCAELQGLPVPQGVSKTDAHTLIGNAVPPKLARAIAEQVFLPLIPLEVPA